jgi:hypothetical protein
MPKPQLTMPSPPLTRDQALALEPRLRAILAAVYALQSGWRDGHGAPLWLPPPTAPQVAAELRDLANLLDNTTQTTKPQ